MSLTWQAVLPRANRARRSGRKPTWPVGLVMPCVVLIVVVSIVPTLFSVVVSTLRWEVQSPTHPFVGLANFEAVLTNPVTRQVFGQTLVISGAALALEFGLGFALALSIFRMQRARPFLLPLLILPITVSPVVAAYNWKMLLLPRFGPLDSSLSAMAGRPLNIAWLASTPTALASIIFTDAWQWTPFVFLVLLAGLASIDIELLDAAAIDGATEWQRLVLVIVPMLKPVLLVALLFRGLDVLNVFGQIFVLTQGGPGYSTQSIVYQIYEEGFQHLRVGYGAAMSLLWLLLVSLGAALVLRRTGEQ